MIALLRLLEKARISRAARLLSQANACERKAVRARARQMRQELGMKPAKALRG